MIVEVLKTLSMAFLIVLALFMLMYTSEAIYYEDWLWMFRETPPWWDD